jgi:hypothetical protein
MKHIHHHLSVRLLTAMLITVGVIVLSSLAAHAPAQNQSWLTLKNIRTDKATSFYADHRANGAWFVEAVLPTGHYADHRASGAWFVEAVLPTGHYADHRASGAWFVEAVLPTGDSDVMTENLKSVAATL